MGGRICHLCHGPSARVVLRARARLGADIVTSHGVTVQSVMVRGAANGRPGFVGFGRNAKRSASRSARTTPARGRGAHVPLEPHHHLDELPGPLAFVLAVEVVQRRAGDDAPAVAHLEGPCRAPRDARDRRERRPPGAAVRTSPSSRTTTWTSSPGRWRSCSPSRWCSSGPATTRPPWPTSKGRVVLLVTLAIGENDARPGPRCARPPRAAPPPGRAPRAAGVRARRRGGAAPGRRRRARRGPPRRAVSCSS